MQSKALIQGAFFASLAIGSVYLFLILELEPDMDEWTSVEVSPRPETQSPSLQVVLGNATHVLFYNPNHLIYAQVPKTGSTTLSHLMRRSFFQNGVVNHTNPKYRHSMSSSVKKSFVQRHFPDGVRKTAFLAHIRYFSHPNFHPIWISLVRDPVERFISRFYYIRRQAERFKAKAREIGRKNAERWLNMTIDECIASAQDECSIQAGRAYEPSPITYFCGFDSPCPLHNSRVALAKAKEHLSRNFSLVGILEEFQPFLARLESKFPQFFRGITQLKIPQRNAAPSRPQVSVASRESLKTMLALEYELHEFIKRDLFTNT